jgi:hypothetical protein
VFFVPRNAVELCLGASTRRRVREELEGNVRRIQRVVNRCLRKRGLVSTTLLPIQVVVKTT